MKPGSITVLVLGVLLMMAGLRMAPYSWNPSALITIGAQWSRYGDLEATLPRGLVVLPHSHGYDGFSYYLQARDPLLQRGEWKDVKNQRLLYPLAAFVLAAGQVSLIPYSLILVNALAILGLALFLARKLQEGSGIPWLAPWAALNAGLLGAFAYNLTEPLAIFTLILAVVAYQRHRLRSCLVWMSLSILTRESHAVMALGLLCHAMITRRGSRWILMAVAPMPWFMWGLWITPKIGLSPFTASAGSFGLPLWGFAEHLVGSFREQGAAFWRREALLLPWMILVLMAAALALKSWRAHRDAPSLLIFLVGLQALCFQAPMWGGILTASRLEASIFPLLVLAPRVFDGGRLARWVLLLSMAFSAIMILRAARVPQELQEFFVT